jgi:hypothetical protein
VNLRIGMTARSAGWEQLLEQTGAVHEVVDPGAALSADSHSVVIVTRVPAPSTVEMLKAYLRAGGAVAGFSPFLESLGAGEPRREQVRYLLADVRTPFARAGLLDVAGPCLIPHEAGIVRTDHDRFALFAGAWQGGAAVIFPFDPAELVLDPRPAWRRFPFNPDRLPAERVSAVGKSALLHLVRESLAFLHQARQLPFVCRRQFPADLENVFVFRIDTDAGRREDVDALHALVQENNVDATWFLHVGAHASWLDRFTRMPGQEIALHCYDHVPLTDRKIAAADLNRARAALAQAALPVTGCAAPYGAWSAGFGAAVEDLGLLYSSEFSFAYDAPPLSADVHGRISRVLQVPVHPIGVGSMRRVGYTPEQMSGYFRSVVERKLLLEEPLFLYHHPADREPGVIAGLFRQIRDAGVSSMTMNDYAAWWRERERFRPALSFDGTVLRCSGGSAPEERVHLVCRHPDGRTARFRAAPVVDLMEQQWNDRPPVTFPDHFRRAREFDPRAWLAQVVTSFSRKLR